MRVDSCRPFFYCCTYGQLTREGNHPLDKTIIYCYDSIGNKTSVITLIKTSKATSSRVNWENGGFQIPIWISSLMSGSDFGASIAPALRTIYQYIRYPGVDTAYTLGTFVIGYGVGALVSLIPGVGVFIAPFVSAGVTWFIDWTNEKWGWLYDVKQWFNDV